MAVLSSLKGWFELDDQHNTSVYVSGLPLDITEEEFLTLMRKCGIIMEDEDGGWRRGGEGREGGVQLL